MVLIVLLISAIYVLFISAEYFLYGDNLYDYQYLQGGEPTKSYDLVDKEISDIMEEFKGMETSYISVLDTLKNNYSKIKEFTKNYSGDPIKRFIHNHLNSLTLSENSITLHDDLRKMLNKVNLTYAANTFRLADWFKTNFENLVDGYKLYSKNYIAWDTTYNYMIKTYPDFAKTIPSNSDNRLFSEYFVAPSKQLQLYEPLFKKLLNKVNVLHPKYTGLIKILETNLTIIKKALTSYTTEVGTKDNYSILFHVLAKLQYPKSIMNYDKDKDPELRYKLGGSISTGLREFPVEFYICTKMIFYVANQDPTVFSEKQIIRYDNIKQVKNYGQYQTTFVNKSIFSSEVYHMAITYLSDEQFSVYDHEKNDKLYEKAYKYHIEAINYIMSPVKV